MISMFYEKEGVSRVFVQIFVSRYQNILLGNNSVYQKNSNIEKVFCMRKGYHDSVSKIFVSQHRKTSQETPSVFQKKSCIEIFHA